MYDTSIKIFEEFLKKYDKYNIKSIFVNNDSRDLLAFAKNGYNKEYYEKTLLSIIEDENLSEYKDVKFCFAEFFDNLDIQEYIKNKKIIKYILLLSQCVIVVEIMIRYKKGMEGTIGLNEVYDNFLQKGKNDFYIFRGQSDYEWRLLPSMFRELKESVEINKKYMLDKYFKIGLFNKYCSIFGYRHDIDYDFISFMQHACSYSPFIDFTKSNIIGISFALSNKNRFNDFHNKDCGLYVVNVNKNNLLTTREDINDFLENQYKIVYLNRKTIGFGELISFKEGNNTRNIIFTKFETIIKMLTPEYKIVDLPINDRMRYQQGLFLVFYNCLCINDTLFYELNPELKYYVLQFNNAEKINFLNKIYKNYRWYDLEHIMNPYLFFNE